jgi:succinate dehydrogenase / fumarate reductase cytochrome b subunit
MNATARVFTSSIGRKQIVALTGLGLVGFVIVHLIGNLNVYLGPRALNDYAHFLQSQKELLWPARIGLLTLFVVHVVLTIQLWLENRRARPTPYAVYQPKGGSLQSRYMLTTGLVILAFVVYHLLHFTFGTTDPAAFKLHEAGDAQRHDVYSMVVHGFADSPVVAAAYVVAMVVLGVHLSHGIPSLFATLGLSNRTWAVPIRYAGLAISVLVVVGNVSMPLLVPVLVRFHVLPEPQSLTTP